MGRKHISKRDYYTVPEVAKRLQTDNNTVYMLIKKYDLAIKLGSRWRIKKDRLYAYEAEHYRPPPIPAADEVESKLTFTSSRHTTEEKLSHDLLKLNNYLVELDSALIAAQSNLDKIRVTQMSVRTTIKTLSESLY